MLDFKTFYADRAGPSLLVLGAVHGDEPCGTQAIQRVLPKIEHNEIHLRQGRVTFIPICNPEAYRRQVRYVDRNLNRDMVRTQHPTSYEQYIANELVGFIEDHDILLDLHSYHVGGPSFAIINEATPRCTEFAASLNPAWVISGWTKAYLASCPRAAERSPTEHIGTTECAYNHGAIDVTLECGQHRDPQAAHVAYGGILRALHNLNMIDAPNLAPARVPESAEMSHVYYSDGAGRFMRSWRHLEFVAAGTIIAERGDGEPLMTAKDGVVLLPRFDAPRGDEWFYLGHLTRNNARSQALGL